jgi:hypothetical protein
MNPNENDNETAQDEQQGTGSAATDVAYTRDSTGVQDASEDGSYGTPVDTGIPVTSEGVVIDQTEGQVTETPVGDLASTVTGDANATQPLDARLDSVTTATAEDRLVSNRIALPVTRGRVVYYTPGSDDAELYGQKALTAHIAEVYEDQGRVNLVVFDTRAMTHRRLNVQFLQAGDPEPDTSFATWMPYQLAQAGIR